MSYLQPAEIATLSQIYSESHRTYHNLNHIIYCLKVLDERLYQTDYYNMVESAIWYHDVIYNPYAKKGVNEKRSADFYIQTRSAKLGIVENCILSSADHFSQLEKNMDTDYIEYFRDIDLSIFAASRLHYVMNYAKPLRREYFCTTSEEYIVGRKKFLETVLAQKAIFKKFTDLEKQARENIGFELSVLEKGITL